MQMLAGCLYVHIRVFYSALSPLFRVSCMYEYYYVFIYLRVQYICEIISMIIEIFKSYKIFGIMRFQTMQNMYKLVLLRVLPLKFIIILQ